MALAASRRRTRGSSWGTDFLLAVGGAAILAVGIVANDGGISGQFDSGRGQFDNGRGPLSSGQLRTTPQGLTGTDERPAAEINAKRRPKREPIALNGTGELRVVPGGGPQLGAGPLHQFLVEVERGLPVEKKDFAAKVEAVLGGGRGWTAVDGVSFQRVDAGPVRFRVTLAGPNLTDSLCSPIQTNGIFSCYHAGRAVINFRRWVQGADAYAGDLRSYRIYVINHEVGHALGHGHVGCPAAGAPAPIMMQQTKGVTPCVANPWPGGG